MPPTLGARILCKFVCMSSASFRKLWEDCRLVLENRVLSSVEIAYVCIIDWRYNVVQLVDSQVV